MLQVYGTSGKTIGMFFRRFVIPLNFDLQVAGPIEVEFFDPSTLQFCQARNSGIQIVVYVLDQLANEANISSASSLILRFQRPDGSTFNRTANFVTNGMDGGIYYMVLATDFIQDGRWQVQASFSLAGDQKTTLWGSFLVKPNIVAP